MQEKNKMHLCGLFLREQIYSDMWEICWSLTRLCQMNSPSLQIKLAKEQQAVSSVMSWLKTWHKLMSIWDDLFWWFDRTHLSGSLPSIWVEPPTPLPSTFLGQGENPPDEYFTQLLAFAPCFPSALALFHNFAGNVQWKRVSSTTRVGHRSHTKPAQICFKTAPPK